MIKRRLMSSLNSFLKKGFSFFLFGPRQSGKTTLVKMLLKNKSYLEYNLMAFKERQKFMVDPSIFRQEVLASKTKLVFVDEIQMVPEILNEIQILIDDHKFQFILTGSSARKIKRKGANLLPGRTLNFSLLPFSLEEAKELLPDFSKDTLKKILKFGELPRIMKLVFSKRGEGAAELLYSYADVYLAEEIKMEAQIRKLQQFQRFLKIAAEFSGKIMSYRNLSREIGISHITISDYYNILEDTLIVLRVPLFPGKTERTKTTRRTKFLFFDTGVVNALLGQLEARDMPEESWANLFEQWVGLSIFKFLYHRNLKGEVYFWREKEKEIDWILTTKGKIIPIEVKWGDVLQKKKIKWLMDFINKFNLNKGIIIFTGERPRKINENIEAIPWFAFFERLEELINDN